MQFHLNVGWFVGEVMLHLYLIELLCQELVFEIHRGLCEDNSMWACGFILSYPD